MNYEQYLTEVESVLKPKVDEYVCIIPIEGVSCRYGVVTKNGAIIQLWKKLSKEQIEALPNGIKVTDCLIFDTTVDLNNWTNESKEYISRISHARNHDKFTRSFEEINTSYRVVHTDRAVEVCDFNTEFDEARRGTCRDGYISVYWSGDLGKCWLGERAVKLVVLACKSFNIPIKIYKKDNFCVMRNTYIWNGRYWHVESDFEVVDVLQERVPENKLYEKNCFDKWFGVKVKPFISHTFLDSVIKRKETK
jgi:hypothetical protein